METLRKRARKAQVDASQVAGLRTRPFPWVSGSALTAAGVRRTLPPKLRCLLRKLRRLPVTTNGGGLASTAGQRCCGCLRGVPGDHAGDAMKSSGRWPWRHYALPGERARLRTHGNAWPPPTVGRLLRGLARTSPALRLATAGALAAAVAVGSFAAGVQAAGMPSLSRPPGGEVSPEMNGHWID